MSTKPFYSIIIPTHNKADYLSFTIQSVLNQTFNDYELIINDNFSTDNTKEISFSFGDNRIKYYKTEKYLSMNESWENALSRAKGEFITFLGDDDAHSMLFLEMVREIIDNYDAKIITCGMSEYTHDTARIAETNIKRNTLIVRPFTNKLSIYNTKEAISNVYSRVNLLKKKPPVIFNCPQLINTVYHKSIFKKATNKVKTIFPNVLSGDFYSAIVSLSVIDKFYVLDAPLSFHGLTDRSTTASITKSLAGEKMKISQSEMTNIKNLPLKIITIPTFITDSLLQVKNDLGKDLEFINIDLSTYLSNTFETLIDWETKGLNVCNEKKSLFEFIGEQSPETKSSIKSALSLNSKTKRFVRSKLRKLQRTELFDFILKFYPRRVRRMLYFNGDRHGFNNLAECSKFVNKEFLEKYKSNESRF